MQLAQEKLQIKRKLILFWISLLDLNIEQRIILTHHNISLDLKYYFQQKTLLGS
jgi:hypothetical protein